ncbi:MAG: DUF4832 domain-containing protein [Thermoclostridium sp.]|nr:DUF4832 domain-containing protein [Thermoclostridium sp.]
MPQIGKANKVKWIPLPRTEKAEALNNPYCGWYSIFRFYAESTCQDQGTALDEIAIDPGHRLCLVEINLLHFNDKPLSAEALQNIRKILQYFTSKGRHLILRFVYDWEGKGIFSEPKDIGDILQHMEQLSAALKEYTRSIYILQGLFIGSWGEMHNSRYLSDRYITRLAKQLYDCSGGDTQIALRCPSYWRMVFRTDRPLNSETAYLERQKARFSLFNDGLLASETDFGTYGVIYACDSQKYGDKWVRQDELEFQNELCRYVSNGGEVFNDNVYNDAAPAIESFRKMRISYLHDQYDQQVLDKWKATKSGSADPLWQNKTAFEYITAHLGYRFTIQEVKLSAHTTRENHIKIGIRLCNKGFSPCYHRFDVKIAVRDTKYSQLYEYGVNTDTRFWMPDVPVELEAELPTEEWNTTPYLLCFGIFDPRSQQAIGIANTFSATDHQGYYSLGHVQINRNHGVRKVILFPRKGLKGGL